MALIKCIECGKEISDRADKCPNCGCPVQIMSPSGDVMIKVSVLRSSSGINGRQKVSIFSNGHQLWGGNSGEVATIHFEGPTNIEVKYHTSLLHYGGTCSGLIDPTVSKKYNVSARTGAFSTKLALSPVDVFDSAD